MKKIISLFKRDYDGNRQVYDEIVEGAGWVALNLGYPTEKVDGTSCLYRDGILYKRYDRKVSKQAKRKKENLQPEDFKPASDGWIPAEDNPNVHTGHWPGWLPVGAGPEDQYHREGLANTPNLADGTYELIGPKVQGNPYNLEHHILHKHGEPLTIDLDNDSVPRDFAGLKQWFAQRNIEGIVWHHPEEGMVKIKRKDFGFPFPDKGA
jgi:hypothetical protein